MSNKANSQDHISSNLKVLHKLMENSSDIVALIDKSFIIRYESPSIRKILGYSPKDLIGKNALTFCHPEDTQKITETVEELLANPNKTQTVRYRFQHKNGSWRVLESIGKNLLEDKFINGLVINTRDITERNKREEQQEFLVEATTILNSSLNYKKTLASVANLVVPKFADWCIVHTIEENGNPEIIALHIEPEKIKIAQELRKRYPPDPEAKYGIAQVIRTGKPELTIKLEDNVIKSAAKDEEHYKMLKKLGIVSCIYVPIKLRKKILGVITLVSSDPKKLYSPKDVDFIEELAFRAGIAMDNAQLYRAAKTEIKKTKKAEKYIQKINKELEKKVKKRTKQLEKINSALEKEIEEKELAQEILQKSQQKLELHVKQTPLAVIEWDLDFKIAQWNPGATKIFGFSQKEAIGKDAQILVSKELWKEVSQIFQKLIQQKGGTRSTNYNITKEGKNIICDWYNTPLVDEKGNVIGVTSLVLDITEQMNTQQALENLTLELQRSNKELQDFASVASHDLQEPLRKIQAFGDRLNVRYAQSLEGDGKDYLERMLNASKRMQILINDLLTFSRVTTKAQPFKKVNLTKVLSEVLSDLEVRIESSNAKIEYNDLGIIEADPLQIRQLFQNLLSNALKFQKPDITPIIKVYTRDTTLTDGTIESTQSKKAIEINFEDNGIGFDEKYLDRIFNVFQRLHNQSEYSGTGVGLAVCRKIVERHGGNITAKSKLAVGSCFIITLPLKQN